VGLRDWVVSPDPSESEAKKRYKKMNVRHYRVQNKDAITQLRDALPATREASQSLCDPEQYSVNLKFVTGTTDC